MLNPTQTCKNRGIMRDWEEPTNIAQPLKTGLDEQFAGKMRARNREKSGESDACRAR